MADHSDNLKKTTIPMPAGHQWVCKPGNNLFIAERGAASFEVPRDWFVQHDGKQTVSIHDLPPPKDSCRISLTIFHLPPIEGGWSALPLDELYRKTSEMPRKKKHKQAKTPRPLELHTEHRPDGLELVWADKGDWPDPQNHKPIHCRQLMARCRLVQVIISFDVYRESEAKFEPAWKDLLRSLRLAQPRDLLGGFGN
jgi:hypothetical protein